MKNVASPTEWLRIAERQLANIHQQIGNVHDIQLHVFNAEHERFVQALQNLADTAKTVRELVERSRR
jgi:ABC-type transporter Mla subunit MlaD